MSRLIEEGIVVSDKMDKTIIVEIKESVKHAKIGKYIQRIKKFKVHDDKNEAKTGDRVKFISCRPISKDKHFRLLKIAEKYVGLGD